MSFPFQTDWCPSSFNRLVEIFRSTVEQFPDERKGDNVKYSLVDAALSTFSVFFTQSRLIKNTWIRESESRKHHNTLIINR